MAEHAQAEATPDTHGLFEFPGWGTAQRILDLGTGPVKITHLDAGVSNKLGVGQTTAISGNDITSSCLYVVALCGQYAGPFAPIALLIVAGTLYLFRRVYGEVVSALPLNGGAYNVLLNTTTKAKASVAASLTLLSYIATAVISAHTAVHYGANLYAGFSLFWATVLLLGIFAFLNIVGIRESAKVALAIFVIHMSTLVVLLVGAVISVGGDVSILIDNWHAPVPDGRGLVASLFFGFAVGMLGISGFETAANFVEEQREGVFPKALRNMWLAVIVFNPLLSFVSMGLIPVSQFANHEDDLLAEVGLRAAGPWLASWVSIDALLVLSGAVLTSYVGVTGLVRRMAIDRCLPQFLLRENRLFGTNHWIILLFLGLCFSILLISRGRVAILAGVYTLSFLGVMALFAIGNMLLKARRAQLPCAERATWGGVAVALLAVCLAVVGNVHLNPAYIEIFVAYFLVTVTAITLMFVRVKILKLGLMMSKAAAVRVMDANRQLAAWIVRRVHEINEQAVIFFTKHSDITELNNAALYVLNNEQTTRLKVVHCFQQEADIPPHLAENLKTLDRIYPRLRIDLILVKGRFGPELIERLSRRLGVPKNYMFIGTPGDRFPHKISELGGVRLIM